MLGRVKTAKPEEEIIATAGTETKEVLPASGKAIKKVTVKPTPSQIKSVTPAAAPQEVVPDGGKLLSKVTVAGDADLVADNIREGVNIFSVLGNMKKSGLYIWKKYSTYNKIVGDSKTSYSLGTSYTNCFMFPKGTSSEGSEVEKIISGNYILYDKAHGRWCYFKYTTSENNYRYISVCDVNTDEVIGDLRINDTTYNHLRYNMSNGSWFDSSFFLIDTNDPYFYTKKSVVSKNDFIEYVVSDDKNEYPDVGVHERHYYEKNVEPIDLSFVGFTQAEQDLPCLIH